MLRKLEFESCFFEQQCGEYIFSDKNIEIIDKEFDWIQCKVSIDNNKKIDKLQNMGFKFFDTRVSFYKKLTQKNNLNQNHTLTEASKKDLPKLSDCGRAFHKKSRFIPVVSSEKVIKFYNLWVEKAILKEFDDYGFILKNNENIVGFLSIKIHNSVGKIGLITVLEEYRKQGFGKEMIKQLENFLIEKKIYELEITTEGKNIIAQNLYSFLGYRIKANDCWFYKIGNI